MTNSLAILVNLRTDIKQTEREIENIMPDALSEALNAFSEDDRVVYRADQGKVILTLRKRVPTIRDSKTLARFNELILDAKTRLAQRQKSKLDRINAQILDHQLMIKTLEKERDHLLTNKRLIQLKSQFIQEQENTSWMEPNLSVYLK